MSNCEAFETRGRNGIPPPRDVLEESVLFNNIFALKNEVKTMEL
jgi:hypothetical protein